MRRHPGGRPTTVGVFTGPWLTGDGVAVDGAVCGFADVERAVREVAGTWPDRVRLVPLDVGELLDGGLVQRLAGLDVVVGNCGPGAALLLWLRERHGLRFRLVREVRTTGWAGYAFQEWVALAWHRDGDRVVHTSPYSLALWTELRGARGDLFHYPILPARPVDTTLTSPRHAAFVGRLAEEKGLGHVPAVADRLRAAGWPLTSVALVGPVVEADRVADVAARLRSVGVAVDVVGPVPHREVQARLQATDVLLFPSRSSVESAGRIVVEALGAGTAVVGSDWVTCHDLLPWPFRIPLRVDTGKPGSGRDPFPWVDLDLTAWRPPSLPARCTLSDAVWGYVRDPSRTVEILLGDEVPPIPPQVAPRLRIGWDQFQGDRGDACSAVLAHLRREAPTRPDLIDLGGAVKRAILGIGFEPEVRLWVRATRPPGNLHQIC